MMKVMMDTFKNQKKKKQKGRNGFAFVAFSLHLFAEKPSMLHFYLCLGKHHANEK